jgi:hypothetical protein
MSDEINLSRRFELLEELKKALQSALNRNRERADIEVQVLDEPKESWRFWRWRHTRPERAKVCEGFVLLVETNRIAQESRFKGRFRAFELDEFAYEHCFSEAGLANDIRIAEHYIERAKRA